jgi:hypothetical protein
VRSTEVTFGIGRSGFDAIRTCPVYSARADGRVECLWRHHRAFRHIRKSLPRDNPWELRDLGGLVDCAAKSHVGGESTRVEDRASLWRKMPMWATVGRFYGGFG